MQAMQHINDPKSLSTQKVSGILLCTRAQENNGVLHKGHVVRKYKNTASPNFTANYMFYTQILV